MNKKLLSVNALIFFVGDERVYSQVTQISSWVSCLFFGKNIYMYTTDALRGLPLITYASRGVGGSTLMHTNAYKGGGGGLNRTKSTHFVRRFIENAQISETVKVRQHRSIADLGFIELLNN